MAGGASLPECSPTPHDDALHIGFDLHVAEGSPGWFEEGPESGTCSLNLVDDLGGAATAPFQSAEHVSKGSLLEGNSNFWTALNLPLAEEYPATGTGPTLFDELSSLSQHQAPLSALDNLDLLHTDLGSTDMLPMYSCLNGFPNQGPTQQLSVGSRLMRFQYKMDQQATAMGAFFSDHHLVEECEEKEAIGTPPATPVAVLLECIKEFTDIIQSLRVVARPAMTDASSHDNHQYVTVDAAPWAAQPDISLSSETALLILSCYLTLMRLCDSLFHGVCRSFGHIPLETLRSLKVKAVFRIGGVSSLQDISAKAYAIGIIDIVQSQIQQLERYLGLPAAYCLSGETVASPSQLSTLEIFATGDRARLLQTVMDQEDIKAHRRNMSFVQSIRENLKKTVAFFGD
jgi:hypothetical protein